MYSLSNKYKSNIYVLTFLSYIAHLWNNISIIIIIIMTIFIIIIIITGFLKKKKKKRNDLIVVITSLLQFYKMGQSH